MQNARPVLAQAWRGFIDYNPNNGILAIATQLGEALEIYDLKDTTQVVRIGSNGEPQFKIADGYGIHVDEESKAIIATDVNNDQPIVKLTFG